MESQLIKQEGEILIGHDKKNKGLKADIDDKRLWEDLPSDVLKLIFWHLLDYNCIRFRLITCKEWQLSGVNSPLIPPSMIQLEDYWSTCFPWLMFFSKPKCPSVFDFFHPITNETYTMHIPELANCMFHCSKYGWLLMSRVTTRSFFFYNPFVHKSTINLPDLPREHWRPDVMSFTAPPTSPDCIVFAVRYNNRSTNIYTCCRGEDHWRSIDYKHDDRRPFDAFHCTPVYYKGVFYQLDEKGRLGASDMKQLLVDDGNPPSLKDLPKPTKPNLPNIDSYYNNYIAECDGEVVSVFVDSKVGYPVHAFKLDWSKMEWVTSKSLDSKTMFISETTGCLLVPAAKTIYENKIYFPNFRNKKGSQYHVTKDKACVFYSLETRKYHAFGCDFSSEDSNDMESFPNSIWIEPNVNITQDEVEDNWLNPLQDDDDNDRGQNVQQQQWG